MEPAARSTETANYTVVARRYRPKSFDQLIGQDHIARALGKAIETGRVGHAYLFTGARGVGKTSTARIFAKMLNIPPGTDAQLAQEIASAIDVGEDIDVIEIDGASNRGIEEIRQLRSNVNVRPSRSPYRIYIIDEVHMLTPAAFNALLKTLEEPPAHVKFIFCTTDPDKIPITVLSRCQRFDFAPVKAEDIQRRLREICEAEGYEADDAALALLARRASGSMRDSQSLLEQVMSFSSGKITVESVNAILGTANENRILQLVERLTAKDALGALQIVAQSQQEGADAGHLAEQLLGYLRDMMALAVGGDEALLRNASPTAAKTLHETATRIGLQTLIAAIQIVDEAIVRMRSSVAATTLLEVALVEICQLEQFASLPELVERLTSVELAGMSQKKKPEGSLSAAYAQQRSSRTAMADQPSPHSPAPPDPRDTTPDVRQSDPTTPDTSDQATESATGSTVAPATATVQSDAGPGDAPAQTSPSTTTAPDFLPGRTPDVNAAPQPSTTALEMWTRAAKRTEGMLADLAMTVESVKPIDADTWKVVFPPGSEHACSICEQPDRKRELLSALAAEAGKRISVVFEVRQATEAQPVVRESYSQKLARRTRELHEHPYIKKLCEELGAEILRIDLGNHAQAPSGSSTPENSNNHQSDPPT